MTNNFKDLADLAFKFFKPLIGQPLTQDELSDPIPIRIPKLLLEEVNAQSEDIGGHRYRSKHLVNLIYLGSNYYRSNNQFIKSLSPEHYSLLTRLNYVFERKGLRPTVVAENLGYKDPQKISGWLNGTIYPEFSELDNFSKVYFINNDWLKHGNNSGNMLLTPYIVENGRFSRDYEKMYNDLININPNKIETIRLIRSKKGNIIISLDFGNKRYISIYYSALKLNKVNSIGSTGFADLVGFASFCRLVDNHMNAFLTMSYDIDEKHFDLLASGQAIPDDLGLWGQSQSKEWYEIIHSEQETNLYDDNFLWSGAIELFKKIQADSNFQKNISQIDEKASKYALLNKAYIDSFF